MGDSQRFALENPPQIAKIIAIHQNFRRYCRKAILYPICVLHLAIPIISADGASLVPCSAGKLCWELGGRDLHHSKTGSHPAGLWVEVTLTASNGKNVHWEVSWVVPDTNTCIHPNRTGQFWAGQLEILWKTSRWTNIHQSYASCVDKQALLERC